MFIRSIGAVIPSLILVHFDSGLGSLKTKRPEAHLLHSTLLFTAYTFYYLEHLPFYENVLPYRETILQKAGELAGVASQFLVIGFYHFLCFRYGSVNNP